MLRTSSEGTATEAPTERAISSEVTRKIRVPSDRFRRPPVLSIEVTAGVGLAGLVEMRKQLRPHHDEPRLDLLRAGLHRQRHLRGPGLGLLVPDGRSEEHPSELQSPP